jgi:hypothetical protein
VFRLDVAVVGFVLFALVCPLGGGYLAAWLLDRNGSDAMVALFAGGTSGPALAAAGGAAVGLAAGLRFTAGSLLDSFVGAWPENRPLVTDPRWRLLNLNSRFARNGGDEIEDQGPVALGGAVGWVGAAAGALLLAGTSVAAWPGTEAEALGRVGAGTASAVEWLTAAFPVIVRVVVASILGILAGAAWSTLGGPAARLEALEADVEKELDELSVVDAPGPTTPPR